MDHGWFRGRWIALTSVVLTIAALGAQVAEQAAIANIEPPHPENPLPLGPDHTELVAIALWWVQGLVAAVGLGFGIAAITRRPGRVIGIVSAVAALGMMLF